MGQGGPVRGWERLFQQRNWTGPKTGSRRSTRNLKWGEESGEREGPYNTGVFVKGFGLILKVIGKLVKGF